MCDTFLALPSVTADGSTIFGKNSDREPNEAQVLEYHPARVHSLPQNVQCTYLAIPQVKETFATLLCRPFWMWGAEMGANEKGVVIGNEAVFTRMPVNRKGGLTGMDLIRLALERCATASEALETIVRLLADFGQGGICGYEDKRMAYHNSFIIADPREGWVLETAAHLWAALRVKDFYAISNGLTIGEAYDACHPQLVETARKRGWLKKGQVFRTGFIPHFPHPAGAVSDRSVCSQPTPARSLSRPPCEFFVTITAAATGRVLIFWETASAPTPPTSSPAMRPRPPVRWLPVSKRIGKAFLPPERPLPAPRYSNPYGSASAFCPIWVRHRAAHTTRIRSGGFMKTCTDRCLWTMRS